MGGLGKLGAGFLCAYSIITLGDDGNPFGKSTFFDRLSVDSKRITTETDVVYCETEEGALKLNLAIPNPPPKSAPALVFVHGGQFVAGNRSGYAWKLAQVAAERGYVALSVDYRLAGNSGGPDTPLQVMASFPAPIDDVRCALRWIRRYASKYHVDPQRIGGWGIGSGAYLAMRIAVTGDSLLADRKADLNNVARSQSDSFQAVLNWFGPSSLSAQYWLERPDDRRPTSKVMGADPVEDIQAFQSHDLANLVRGFSAPILTFHGTQDAVYPFSHATNLDSAINKVKGYHSLVPVPGKGHGFLDPDGTLDTDVMVEIVRSSFGFFDLTLQQNGMP